LLHERIRHTPDRPCITASVLAIASLLILLLPSFVGSQSLDVGLRGKVADDSGAGLPGAMVTAIDEATGVLRSANTDREGYFILLNLPASTYSVRAELDGFSPKTLRALTLHVGTTVALTFSLKLAGVTESVEVRGNLPALETSKNTVTRIVQAEEIDALPVINRNFNDLAALAPGVTKTGVYGGVDISGSRDFQNAYQVDGVSAERQALGDQQIPYAQDWIQEFQVMTSQFNPEFGQAAGGVLNAITRSGGNQIAGRIYGFLRDDAWDATPALVTRKPPLSEHRIGGTVGGPVVKRRLFYFAGIERFSNESSNVVSSAFQSANGTFPSTSEQTLFIGKLDAVAGRDQRVRVRYNGQRELTTGSAIGGTSTQEHGRFSDVRANDVVGNWTWVVSPRMLNEVRAAWSTSFPQGGCNFAIQHPPGTWFELAYPGGQFGCPVNVGTVAENQFQFVDNVTWTRGKHDLKAGVQTYSTRSFGDFRNFRDGRFAFERDVPFDLGNPESYPFSFSLIDGPTAWDVSAWSGGAFVQDSWRLTDDFTLNLGARYDVDGSLTALNPLVRVDKGLHTIKTDLNNVAPRIGAAWTPFHDEKRTLVRGGVGLYYDQNHNNVTTTVLLNNILVDRIIVVNANNSLLNPFWPDTAAAKRFLAEALAQNRIPDTLALRGLAGSTNDVDQGLQIPATMQASGGMAYEFRRWLNASADIVYARGFDLYVIRDVNLDPITFQRVNPNYSSVSTFGNGGWNAYKALQVQVNMIPNAQHLLKVAYTLATNHSNTNATLSAGVATNPFDYSEDAGPTDNDVRHNLTMNGSTTLPLGVQVSGIFSYQSALPYSAVTNAPRPDGKPFGFRLEPRNARRGDPALSVDLRLAKIVRFNARLSASAFIEVFNLTNEVNYGDYIGTVTSTLFGKPTTAGPMRRTQLGFRLNF
jgi:carboxypeptidase family protein/TonB-dependent receptor-like protein